MKRIVPHFCVSEDGGELTLEWWLGDRSLCCWFDAEGEDVYHGIERGAGAGEMRYHDFPSLHAAYAWLTGGERYGKDDHMTAQAPWYWRILVLLRFPWLKRRSTYDALLDCLAESGRELAVMEGRLKRVYGDNVRVLDRLERSHRQRENLARACGAALVVIDGNEYAGTCIGLKDAIRDAGYDIEWAMSDEGH